MGQPQPISTQTAGCETDALTGLHRLGQQSDALDRTLEAARRASRSLALALVDLDDFARVNDQLGHDGGDRVLRELAAHLAQAAADGTAYRFGGDAFLLVWDGVEKEQAFLRVEEARQAFVAAESAEAPRVSVTVSAGVAGYPDDGATAQELVRKALDALYRAKVTGRDKVCLAREERMVTKTTHYTQGQLEGLSRLGRKMGISEATLLREALDDLLRKHNA
jgi:diguanylate cyclase (GGDEF)-like protein